MDNFKIKGSMLEEIKSAASDDFQYIRFLNVVETMNSYARQLGVYVFVVDIETQVQTDRFRVYTFYVDCDSDVGNALNMKLITVQKFTRCVEEIYQLEIAE